MSTRSSSRKKTSENDWYLVQFKEDGVLLACSAIRTKIDEENGFLARWPVDGQWYPARIIHSGDQKSVTECHNKYSEHNGQFDDTSHFAITPHAHVRTAVKDSVSGCTSTCSSTEGKEKSEQGNSESIQNEQIITPENSPTHSSSFTELSVQQLAEQNRDSSSYPCDSDSTGIVISANNTSASLGKNPAENVSTYDIYTFMDTEDTTELSSQSASFLECKTKESCTAVSTYLEGPTHDDESDFENSSDEYAPSDDISSTHSSSLDEVLDKRHQTSKCSSIKTKQVSNSAPDVQCNNSQFLEKDVFTRPTLGDEDSDLNTLPPEEIANNDVESIITTMVVRNTGTKRVWDKKHFCVYCKTMQSKLPRHLERKHSNEVEVAQFLSLPKKSTERLEKISALRGCGLFQHNTAVFKSGSGVLIPKRRPNKPTKPTKYLPCEVCGELFSKKQLSRHQSKCQNKSHLEKQSGRDRGIQARSALLLPTGRNTCQRFKSAILSKMINDEVFSEIVSDKLILAFGENVFEKLGHEERHHRMVADRCRELGRFMLKVKEIDPNVKRLTDLISPSRYQTLKRGVQIVVGFDYETNTFRTPSLALKLGQSIKKCAYVLKGSLMKDNVLKHNVQDINNFLELVDLKWTNEMTTKAHRTLEERKWNAPRRLPLAKDVVLLNKFLLQEDERLCSQIIKQPTANIYDQLSQIALCRTLVLNRRRVGEVQYMTVKDYKNTSQIDPDSDTFMSLSEAEKSLTKKLRRVEIRGKKGRKVPVILTEDLQSTMNILVEKREQCGVSADNKYLFPSLRHGSGHFRAHVVLKRMAEASGAQNPSSLTSTRLRKHVATMAQLLNLRTNELDALATFMGHDIRVHRQYYRLQDDAVELAKVSKLLINLDKGKLSSMKNKNLDELTVASDESLSEEDDIDYLEQEVLEEPDLRNKDNSLAESSGSVHALNDGSKNIRKSRTKITKTTKKTKTIKKSVKPRPWGHEELLSVRQFFKGFIHLKKVPRKGDIVNFLEKYEGKLQQRSWSDVKWCVKNSFNKL